mmetsp:Transcript_6467/g.14943  ORF Transcript_6467/g.14943 Transcript_6467/m.14943 type:complete len:223 (-) Transcript_6467:433-1101(-)
MRLDQRVVQHAVGEVGLQIVHHVDDVELDVLEHRPPCAALPVLPLGTAVEEGLQIARVEVDKTLVGSERELLRDRHGHVRVAAAEKDHVARGQQSHLARLLERLLLRAPERRCEERVVVLVEECTRCFTVGPDGEKLTATEILADVRPENLVDMQRRAAVPAADEYAFVVPVPVGHRVCAPAAHPILDVRVEDRFRPSPVQLVPVFLSPPQLSDVHAVALIL